MEIDADIHATILLNKTGFSGQNMIDALKVLHQATGSTDCKQDRIDGTSRDYPTLCTRVGAVKRTMKF